MAITTQNKVLLRHAKLFNITIIFREGVSLLNIKQKILQVLKGKGFSIGGGAFSLANKSCGVVFELKK